MLYEQVQLSTHARQLNQASPHEAGVDLAEVHAVHAEVHFAFEHVLIHIQLQRIKPPVTFRKSFQWLAKTFKRIVERDAFGSLPVEDRDCTGRIFK